MTPEQKQKLAELKGSSLVNLTRIRQAKTREERDSAIAEHINSYIAEVGNDHELADAFLTWLNNQLRWGKEARGT
jgi:DNA integrity scanning protein DisA with diadenylate cyclase activity